MPKIVDVTGERFGRLIAIKLDHRDKKSNSYWLCKCDCGTEKLVRISDLRSGNTKSCGCLHTEIRRKLITERSTSHGFSNKERLYTIWRAMKLRCYTKSNISYKYYGQRGINVCDEWKDDYLSFRNWALNNGYKDDLTIDRIDVNGDYDPSNCKWATSKEQAINKRNNRNITYKGTTKTIGEWSVHLGINKSTLLERIRMGWDEVEALTKPVGSRRRCN